MPFDENVGHSRSQFRFAACFRDERELFGPYLEEASKPVAVHLQQGGQWEGLDAVMEHHKRFRRDPENGSLGNQCCKQ
eukprot:1903918-Amphidinium_carterae.1